MPVSEVELSSLISTHNSNMISWVRYVDDILCLVKDTEEVVNDILKTLNELRKNIGFTVIFDSDHCLNFLDLTLTRHEDRLAYNI